MKNAGQEVGRFRIHDRLLLNLVTQNFHQHRNLIGHGKELGHPKRAEVLLIGIFLNGSDELY
jgi:hypothetical protein